VYRSIIESIRKEHHFVEEDGEQQCALRRIRDEGPGDEGSGTDRKTEKSAGGW